jgi:hypothetical protein
MTVAVARKPESSHTHVSLTDGTAWPFPGEMLCEVDHALRYGNAEKLEWARLTAASVIGAYIALIGKTQKRRNEICKCLQAVTR